MMREGGNMCQMGGGPRFMGFNQGGCGCGCGGGGGAPQRRFMTRREKIAMLEDYKKELEAELEGLKEKIAKIKSCSK
ncbi:MAG: hypothetical protein WC614_06430 [bacterium]